MLLQIRFFFNANGICALSQEITSLCSSQSWHLASEYFSRVLYLQSVCCFGNFGSLTGHCRNTRAEQMRNFTIDLHFDLCKALSHHKSSINILQNFSFSIPQKS